MRVARAFHRDPHAVAAEPFARTAWSLLELLEVERIESLAEDGDRLREASLTAIAYHEPKRLEDERKHLLARVRESRSPNVQGALARGRAMIERLRRGKVLDG